MINNLRIQNYRGFKDLSLTLGKTNVLVGANGTGKTSILDAVDLLLGRGSVPSKVSPDDFHADSLDQFNIEADFSAPVEVSLPDGYQTQKIPCSGVKLVLKRREKAGPGKLLNEPYTASRFFIPTAEVSKTKSGWSFQRKGGSEFKFTERLLGFPGDSGNVTNVFFFDKSRERQSKIGFNSTLSRLSDEFNWRFRKSLESTTEYVQAWDSFYQLVISGVSESKISEILGPVFDRFQQLTGRESDRIELSLLNLEEPFSKAFFALRSSFQQIPQDKIGSGLSILFSFCLLDHFSSFSKVPLLLLVDEPELHLHPQLQRSLKDYFFDSDIQVLYTTHSETMVHLRDWECLRKLGSDFAVYPNESSLQTQLLQKKHLGTAKEHLAKMNSLRKDELVLIRQNMEIFFASRVLLTEGPLEKIGLEILAARFNKSLSNVTVISCNGKESIFYYQLLCHAFRIPFLTVFDLDGGSEVDENNASLVKNSYGNNYFVFPESFEAIFGTATSRRKTNETIAAIKTIPTLPLVLENLFQAVDGFNHDSWQPAS